MTYTGEVGDCMGVSNFRGKGRHKKLSHQILHTSVPCLQHLHEGAVATTKCWFSSYSKPLLYTALIVTKRGLACTGFDGGAHRQSRCLKMQGIKALNQRILALLHSLITLYGGSAKDLQHAPNNHTTVKGYE